MAYREKLAWLALAGMVIAYGTYFAIVAAAGPIDQSRTFHFLLLFAIASVVRIVIEFGGMAIVVLTTAAPDRRPRDERDREIVRRSASTAYYVLMAGMLIVGVVMPFSDHGWAITNAALMAIVLAEIVRCLVLVRAYRRGLA